MFSFHTTTHASFPCGEDQTAAWSEVAGHNQQATPSFNGGAPGPLTSHDLDRIFAPVLDDLAPTGLGLSGLDAASAGAFNPGYSYAPNVQDQYNHNHMSTGFYDAWLAPTPPLTDSDTIPSPASDAPWDGDLLLPTSSAPEPQDGSFAYSFAAAAPPPPSHAEMAWHYEPGQPAHLTTPFTDGNRGMMGPYFNFPNTFGAMSGSTKPWTFPLGVADTGASQVMMPGTYMPELPRTILRKRPRSAEETNNDFTKVGNDSSPRRVKRRTGVNGVLGAAGSASRARQKPATETPVRVNGKSEAAGRGAGMLAAPIAHEVYHQSLPGPSVQEALMGTTAQGQLPWIEGSEVCVNLTFTGNAVGQLDVVNNTATDGEGENAEEDGFRIPKRLSERQQLLLMATPEERARGVVRVLKCVVCPKSGFGRWESFTRHCERTEGHPEDLFFCRFCGDFFSRPEARDRHEKDRPDECFNVSPAKAEEKRTVTLHVHEGFKREIDEYLRFGGKMGEPFCQRIKKLYPDSSKRGNRQQNRLKA